MDHAELRWDPPRTDPESGSPADRFVRLACLVYDGWRTSWPEKARALLAEEPGLPGSDLSVAAAAGDVAAVGAWLDREPDLVDRKGGPFGWEPLLYACYSRIDDGSPGRSTTEVARLLLSRGADPNAGFLLQGEVPPFTALTAVFGDGEDGHNQPAHHEVEALARLLLEAGADPNDGQTLYNRHFRPNDAHLRLLLEFGLGRHRGGPWYRRLGDRLHSPARLLSEELWAAARKDFRDRVRLLVEHGADVNARGLRDGRTPYEAALLAGNGEVAEYLLANGAERVSLSPDAAFAAACVSGRRAEALALLAERPGLKESLGPHGRVALVHRAVEAGRAEGVRLMAELGFEIAAMTSHDGVGVNLAATPMHNAAWLGNLALVKLLLSLGADPTVRDPNYQGTPRDWAEHNGQTEVAEYLARLAPAP